MLKFVFGMFATGQACLPAAGMQAIPQQLAASLPPDSLRLRSRVFNMGNYFVRLESGEVFSGKPIVIACDGDSMTQLLIHDLYSVPEPSRGVSCLYFAAAESPVRQPILVLNGNGHGPINNLSVPTLVSPTYGPSGKHLISVTVLGSNHDPHLLLTEVEQQLFEWYGAVTKEWQHLRTYSIPYALPPNSILELARTPAAVRHSPGVYLCGDHFGNASIQGALVSGRRAAEALIADRLLPRSS
jgi:hypothetical protein